MRAAIPIACVFLCLGIGREVYGQDKPMVRLTYLRAEAAGSCPDEKTMQRGVAARLGRQPFDNNAARELTVKLEAAGLGYSVAITVRDAKGEVVGERTLSTKREDCAELASAMQLAIAIAIDPLHNMTSAVPDPAPPPVVVPAPPVPAAPAPNAGPPLPPPVAEERSTKHVGAGLVLGGSSEPNPSVGLTVQYGHRSPNTSWALEARIDKPSEISAMAGQVQTSLFSGSFLLCLQPQGFDLCALASLGNRWGGGSGYSESLSFQTPYGAGGVRIGYHFSVQDNFDIQVSGDLLGRVTTTTLVVDDEEVWTSGRLEFALGARALWRIE